MTGARIGLLCLHNDLLERIKSYLDEEDLFAYFVALKLGLERLCYLAWDSQSVETVCDPATKRLVSRSLRFVDPPPRVLRVLPAFENVQYLHLDDLEGEHTLGSICPVRLRDVTLTRCTLRAGDVVPQALVCVTFKERSILLGPAGKQWPLLSSPYSFVDRFP